MLAMCMNNDIPVETFASTTGSLVDEFYENDKESIHHDTENDGNNGNVESFYEESSTIFETEKFPATNQPQDEIQLCDTNIELTTESVEQKDDQLSINDDVLTIEPKLIVSTIFSDDDYIEQNGEHNSPSLTLNKIVSIELIPTTAITAPISIITHDESPEMCLQLSNIESCSPIIPNGIIIKEFNNVEEINESAVLPIENKWKKER